MRLRLKFLIGASSNKVNTMKRLLLIAGIATMCLLIGSPRQGLAHGWRWGCRSYNSGYTYYYPSYYSNYNNCYGYYGNYGSYYGSGYSPYSNYGYYSPYNNFGPGFGGGNVLGLLAGNSLTGANLSGSLVQPSYLSMPVSVGYGPSGYLQIPLGSPAGRASYLQIPVSSGFGPPSFLQIELGRNSSGTVPSAPAPSATPTVPPYGAVPGVGTSTLGRLTYDIPKTASDDVPTIVSTTEESLANDFKAGETTENSPFQFVSLRSEPASVQAPAHDAAPRLTRDTSFSLVGPKGEDRASTQAGPDSSSPLVPADLSNREELPWVVK